MTTQQDIKPMEERPYRRGIGVLVFNEDNKVLVCERSDIPGAWQMPQGGITEDEIQNDIIGAGLRELQEETGITSVSLIGITKEWTTYDFPQGTGYVPNHSHKYRGQKQRWMAVRFEGNDDEISLDHFVEEIEFTQYEWVDLEEAVERITPIKKEVYQKIADCFAFVPTGEDLNEDKVKPL